MSVNWKELQAPIDQKYIKQVNKGFGRTLSYVDAPALMERLDKVLGPEGWETDEELTWHGDCPTVKCVLSIKVSEHEDGTPRWRDKAGWGGPNNVGRVPASGRKSSGGKGIKDSPLFVEDDEPVKSAASDAFRRACRKWGIGRELWLSPASAKAPQASSKAAAAPETGGDTTEEDRGSCTVHGVPFSHKMGISKPKKEGEEGKPYDFWSCPERNEDGSYCKERPQKQDTKGEQSLADSAPAEDLPTTHDGWQSFIDMRLMEDGVNKVELEAILGTYSEIVKVSPALKTMQDLPWTKDRYRRFWMWYEGTKGDEAGLPDGSSKRD